MLVTLLLTLAVQTVLLGEPGALVMLVDVVHLTEKSFPNEAPQCEVVGRVGRSSSVLVRSDELPDLLQAVCPESVAELPGCPGKLTLRRAQYGFVPIEQSDDVTTSGEQVACVEIAVDGLGSARLGVEPANPSVQLRVVPDGPGADGAAAFRARSETSPLSTQHLM